MSLTIAYIETCAGCDRRLAPKRGQSLCGASGRSFMEHVDAGDCPEGRYVGVQPKEVPPTPAERPGARTLDNPRRVSLGVIVPAEVVAERLAKCEPCPDRDDDVCKIVKARHPNAPASIAVGVRMPAVRCPKGEWDRAGPPLPSRAERSG